jgi:hypothetical protein
VLGDLRAGRELGALRFCMAWKFSTSPFVPCVGFETQTPGINVKACELVTFIGKGGAGKTACALIAAQVSYSAFSSSVILNTRAIYFFFWFFFFSFSLISNIGTSDENANACIFRLNSS